MLGSVYDPQGIEADAFARDNHTGTQTLATISDAGAAAGLNVGTTAGTVAAGDHTHSNATTSVAGFMSATDKTKLDELYSGVYTPTCTNNGNVASFTNYPLRVFRTGKYVQVSGLLQISATAGAGTATSFNMTLPFASALTGAQQLAGSGAIIGQNTPVGVLGDVANDRAQITLAAPASGTLTLSVSFSYEVL